MTANIRLEGGPELREIISSLARLRKVRAAVLTAGAHVKSFLQEYPPQPNRPQPFKTDRQRRYFFWALRAGSLVVPYRRGTSPGSRNLKQMWTVDTADDGLTAVVSNNSVYGPLVQGDSQTAYHKYTGWTTAQAVANKERDVVVELLANALMGEL